MQSFSIEHIVPRGRGGATALDNLALSCQGCNNHKHLAMTGRDPATKETVPLYHPRRQHWTEHFEWSADFTRVVGLTPTGRATVETLRLNRQELVNLRHVLYALGEHPPQEE